MEAWEAGTTNTHEHDVDISGPRAGIRAALVATMGNREHIARMTDKPLRVKIRRNAKAPNLYRWEIYRGPVSIERSMQGYPTEQAAAEAGYQFMARLLNRKSAAKNRV